MKAGGQDVWIRITEEAKNRKKAMTLGWLIGGLVVCAAATSAQEPSTREALAQEPAAREAQIQEAPAPRGFYFNSPLSMNAVHEENIPVGRSRFKDEVLLLTAPEFSFRSVGERADFMIGYKPEVQLFRHHPHLNTWDNAARFRLVHRPTSRWMWDATNSFLQTEDPGRVLGESVFLLPRGQFLENTFSLNVDYDMTSRTRLTPSFLHTVSKLLLPELRETDLFTGRFETQGAAAGVSLSHMLDPQQQVFGAYTFFSVQDLERGIHFPFLKGSRTHGISVGYRYGFRPRGISVELSGGALRSGSTTYRVAARFEKRWAAFVFRTGYSREIALLSGFGEAARLSTGVLPSNFYHMAMMDLEGRLGDRWGLELRAQVGRSNSGIQITDIDSLFGHICVSYGLTNRIYPFIGADIYQQSYSEFLLTSLARRRYFAGISIVFSRPEEWQGVPPRTGEWSESDSLPTSGSSSRNSTSGR
ncbi:MAG: hypothetical protein HY313_03555 [Acidobacteria bacterium]|nr:hypothetical protein [Acidobacteriota bacterium]